MKPIRFKSILAPDATGYEYTGDSMTFWEHCYRNHGCLGGGFGYYDTLGDRGVQHTPLMACRLPHFTDYCVSLVSHLIANPADAEGISGHHFGLNQVGVATLEFLSTVVYREEKRQWFNWRDLKLSSSESKEHDKRWTRVPTGADGTIASVFRLCLEIRGNASLNFMERYALESHVWETLYSKCSTGHDDWEKLTNWRTELLGDHASAFRALRLTVEAFESLGYAKRVADSAVFNSRPAEVSQAA